jgi:hypothetical protein
VKLRRWVGTRGAPGSGHWSGAFQTGFVLEILVQVAANPFLVPFDLYVLRYPVGSHIPPHRDPVPSGRHYRLNVVIRRSSAGGAFICDKPIYSSKRISLFRSDISTHSVTTVEGRPRYVLSLGWILR